ncbi:monovalent cation/H+ antiporter complex subunit F [Poriferisphaera sp. WC338]|uniref:monovalent cation/H+ antiporter complex subunit F n=1 Tax=Poriferisphaera sp. WC338 TaxID=3425129 RepID=UPI003D813FCD
MNNLILAAAATTDEHAPAVTAKAYDMVNPFSIELLNVVLWCGTLSLVIGIVMCLIRIWRGPHHADRVLAADTLSLQVVGLVVILTISLRQDLFFDAVLAVAILGFASTIAFSQYIGARAQEKIDRLNKEAGQ